MRIQIELGESLKSPHDGKTLLPQIKVASSMPLSVYGLYDNKPNFLELKREDSFYSASWFLHENITAHIHTGNFNLFITNTRNFIGCLATNEETAFTTTLAKSYSQEREVDISDTLVQSFFVLYEDETYIIEPLSFDVGKDTDKIASC